MRLRNSIQTSQCDPWNCDNRAAPSLFRASSSRVTPLLAHSLSVITGTGGSELGIALVHCFQFRSIIRLCISTCDVEGNLWEVLRVILSPLPTSLSKPQCGDPLFWKVWRFRTHPRMRAPTFHSHLKISLILLIIVNSQVSKPDSLNLGSNSTVVCPLPPSVSLTIKGNRSVLRVRGGRCAAESGRPVGKNSARIAWYCGH